MLDHVPTELLNEVLPVISEPVLNNYKVLLSLGHVPKFFIMFEFCVFRTLLKVLWKWFGMLVMHW